MFSSLLTETVQIVRRAGDTTDGYGTPEPAWAAAASVAACVQLVAASENVADRDTQTARWRCWLPPGTALTGRDRVILTDGTVTKVDGPPAWRLRRIAGGAEHHVYAELTAAKD